MRPSSSGGVLLSNPLADFAFQHPGFGASARLSGLAFEQDYVEDVFSAVVSPVHVDPIAAVAPPPPSIGHGQPCLRRIRTLGRRPSDSRESKADIVAGSLQDLYQASPTNGKPLSAVWHFFRMRKSDDLLKLAQR